MRRPRRYDEDSGSIAILMMVVLVGALLSAMLIPMVITQDRSTRFDSTRVQAVDAAQAGTDACLGLVRAAVTQYGPVSGVVYTDSSKLPCAVSGVVNGTASGNNPATYSVTAIYYTQAGATISCSASLGLATTAGSYASYVVISSTGSPGTSLNGASAVRTLDTTYVFKTKTTTSGGAIAWGSNVTRCIDSGSALAGSSVTVQTCGDGPTSSQQRFLYRSDLTLQLPSSISVSNPYGLCLDTAGSQANDPIQLNPCVAFGRTPAFTQQWSYDQYGRFQATLATSASSPGTLAGVCIDPGDGSVGRTLSLASCLVGTPSAQAWRPAATVATGAADLPQWVSYGEFSRCIDVPGNVISSNHLWSYPCTQNPYPAATDWSQSFKVTTTVSGSQLSTTVPGDATVYCLTSTGLNAGYPTMQACGRANQQWTINTATAPTYSAMYEIVDAASGLCLGLSAPFGTDAWSAIDVETCSGTADQKWNVNPTLLIGARRNTTER